MDNLEERLRIYNRNINLQIHLAGKVQALDAMELRGVDEERIDSILLEYEEELATYASVLDTEDVATSALPNELDDSAELRALEAEILGTKIETPPTLVRQKTSSARESTRSSVDAEVEADSATTEEDASDPPGRAASTPRSRETER